MIRIDPDTGMGETIYAVTEAWKKTMGVRYPYEDTIKKCLLSFSIDSDMDKLFSELQLKNVIEQIRQCGSHTVYFPIQSEKSPFQTKKVSFFQSDSELWFIIRDITDDFKKVSEIISGIDDSYQSVHKELEKKNVFWNLMNRNLRTPLHSIVGLTWMAEENAGENAALESYLRKISMSGTYMNDTIDDILDLRRISDANIRLVPTNVRLFDFLETIKSHMEPICEDKELVYFLRTDFSPGLVVNVDSHVLFKILTKLLYSAIRYMVKGGRVQLNAKGLLKKRDKITIEFSVDCVGLLVDRERFKSLLQPYDVLPEMLERDTDFLDVGLIILKRYAKAMGSDVLMVESHENKGMRISLNLTMDIVTNAAEPDDMGTEDFLPRMAGLRVLVVDDNDTNLDVTKKVLCSKGVDVVTAMDGLEAVRIFADSKGKFDMIIMDVVMPGMDGLEATRQIRAMENIPTAKTIPVIAMTANAFYEDFEESFQVGMNAHLVKPVEPEWLFRVMANILEESAAGV